MARNGSGTYTLPAGNPVVTGSTISSTWANNTLNDIATALTGSIAKDGQTTPTGNLPMGGFNHTNVADATVRTQYATAGQVQDGAFTLLTSVSGTNAITATGAVGMSAYVAGQRFSFVAAGNNTGAATININAIGAKAITKSGTTALASGDIVTGAIYQIIYDGTQFQVLNPSTPIVSSFSAGTTGLTPNTATTGAVTLAGTLAVANGGTGVTTSTGSGNNVLSTSPTLSTPTLTSPTITGASVSSMASSVLTSGTAQATTSGTSVTFTGIPSWVKRITVMFNNVQNSGAQLLVQLGSGSITTTGYASSGFGSTSSSAATTSATTGFLLSQVSSTGPTYGTMVITNLSGNIWTYTSTALPQSSYFGSGAGAITLSGTLDRLAITTVSGTATFSAGSVNIIYE